MLNCCNFVPEIINSSNRTKPTKREAIPSLRQSTHIASHLLKPGIFLQNPDFIPPPAYFQYHTQTNISTYTLQPKHTKKPTNYHTRKVFRTFTEQGLL